MTVQTPVYHPSARALSPWRFTLLAAQLLAVTLLLGALIVYLTSRAPAVGETRTAAEIWQLVCNAVQAVILGLVVVSAAFIPAAIRTHRRVTATTLAGVAIMYAVVAIGFELLKTALTIQQPLVISVQTPTRPPPLPSAAVAAADAAPGDAVPVADAFDLPAGKRAYTATCAGCHGVAGQGLTAVAPALVGTPYMRERNDQQLADVIIRGVAVGDPANHTGRVMPARGGNPFLSDADVTNIVAFLRSLDGDRDGAVPLGPAAADAPDATEPTLDPTAALPRWVVPAPPRPQPALRQPGKAQPPNDGAATAPIGFRVAFASVLTIHLLIGIGLTGALLWQAHAGRLNPARLSAARFVCGYWMWTFFVWMTQLPPLFLL